MDPVTLIVAVLSAGAVAGAQDTATKAVKDAYAGLKSLVRRRVAGRPAGEAALVEHESKPEHWAPALEAELVESDAANDLALVEAAQRLLSLADAAGTSLSKYQVDVRGSSGVQIGDGNTQSNTLTTPPG